MAQREKKKGERVIGNDNQLELICMYACSHKNEVYDGVNNILYVQEVVTLQKKCLIYLHQKMRFTPFIDYYDTLGLILFVYRAKSF